MYSVGMNPVDAVLEQVHTLSAVESKMHEIVAAIQSEEDALRLTELVDTLLALQQKREILARYGRYPPPGKVSCQT